MIANVGSVPNRQPWLFAPAVAVMNRLTYPRKFALISLLFVTPLALVMGLLISEMNARIEFARKEIQGDPVFAPLRQLFEHVLQSRALAHAYGNGKVSLRPGLIGKQAEIAEDLATLQAIERELGHNLRTTSKHDALRENARFLREKLFKLEAGDSDELHRQLLAEIHDLGAYVGNTSNLILDPDLDSYYLMDAILLELLKARTSWPLRVRWVRASSRAGRPRWRRGRSSSACPACCVPTGRRPRGDWTSRSGTIPRPT